VGKPEGISNVFLTYFDYFFGGQYKLGRFRGTREELNPPDKSRLNRSSIVIGYKNITSGGSNIM
jgi:hypothetical protein